MLRARFVLQAVFACLSLRAAAVVGSGDSATTPLENVSPTLQSAAITGERSLDATFSEALSAATATTPEYYTLGGPGNGESRRYERHHDTPGYRVAYCQCGG